MSEHGYGWWQAADGNSYPPEQHPDHRPDDSTSYGWWQAADGNSYPPSQHPEYRAATPPPPTVQPPPGYEAPATTVMPGPTFEAAPPSTMDQAGFTPPPPTPMSQPGFMPPPPGANPGFTLTPGLIGLLVASALIVLGSVLPWASLDLGEFSTLNINGLDGDGRITLVLGLITAALGLASRGWVTGFAIGAIVSAALCALIAVIDIVDVSSTFDGFGGEDLGFSVGYGLWLVLIASLGAIAASIVLIVKRPT